MIKAKTHKAKSDKETIIDMEPVNDTPKTIILKNPIYIDKLYSKRFLKNCHCSSVGQSG